MGKKCLACWGWVRGGGWGQLGCLLGQRVYVNAQMELSLLVDSALGTAQGIKYGGMCVRGEAWKLVFTENHTQEWREHLYSTLVSASSYLTWR